MARGGGLRRGARTEDGDQNAGDEHGHRRAEGQAPHQPGPVTEQHPGLFVTLQQGCVVLGDRRAVRPSEFGQSSRPPTLQHAGRVRGGRSAAADHWKGDALEPVGQRRVIAVRRRGRGAPCGREGRRSRGGRRVRVHWRGQHGGRRGRGVVFGGTFDGPVLTFGGGCPPDGGLRDVSRGSAVLRPLRPVPPAQQASRGNGILVPAGRRHLHASSYADVTLRSRWPSSHLHHQPAAGVPRQSPRSSSVPDRHQAGGPNASSGGRGEGCAVASVTGRAPAAKRTRSAPHTSRAGKGSAATRRRNSSSGKARRLPASTRLPNRRRRSTGGSAIMQQFGSTEPMVETWALTCPSGGPSATFTA